MLDLLLDDNGYLVGMVFLLVSLLGLGAGLLRVVFPRAVHFSWSPRFWFFLLVLIGSVLIVDLVKLAEQSLRGNVLFFLLLGLCAGGVICFQTVFPWSVLPPGPRPDAKSLRLPLALLLVSFALTAWFFYRLEQRLNPRVYYQGAVVKTELDPNGVSPSWFNLVDLPATMALTDKGTPIKLSTYPEGSPLTEVNGTPPHELPRFRGRLMQTAPADVRYSCHGWTFAGGRYHLGAVSVEHILLDNGYEPVTEPKGGDLILYRHEDGRIIHTGVVKAISMDGMVLIESKWGFWGRYLHAPEDQYYSQNYTFYRSSRKGHLLNGVEPRIGPVPVSG